MGLSAGTRLGPYEIEGMLGAGGMGEVYRARDTRLNRQVAVKVLPDSLSSDPERVARLTREARVLASVNHPHIGAIYEFEQADGVSAMILELVEGITLEDRLRAGALPEEEALAIARQIASALEAAHSGGIMHRDLKPSNVKVTPGGSVKILDFGIARALDLSRQPVDGSGPTATDFGMTRPGIVVGTPAYMSPEQARGEPVDKRTDVWAFGVVLYEMLTGRRPFQGHSATDTLAAVLKEVPDWTRVPTRAQRVVRLCLEKDPERRLRDIGDAMLLVDDVSARTLPAGARASWIWPAAAVLSLAAAAGVWIGRGRPDGVDRHAVTFQIAPRPQTVQGAPVVSPDGRSIAFSERSSETTRAAVVWVHSLETGQSRRVFETANMQGGLPFWSPDSRSLAVAADGKLSRVDVATGVVHTLAEVRPTGAGGAWSKEGVILFSESGLMRVSPNGGTPIPVTVVNREAGEIGHFLPVFLPDGRHFLYLRASPGGDTSGIYVGSLDARPDQQDLTRLAPTRAGPVYAPALDGRGGHLLFLRDASLMAQPLDPAGPRVTGDPVLVAERIAYAAVPSSRFAFVSASQTGVLAYRQGEPRYATPVWVDRKGRELGPLVPAPLERAENPRFSPDGRRLALFVAGDLWVYDLSGKPPVKLTSAGESDIPLWTPDGRRIVFASNSTPMRLLSVAADGTSETPQQISPYGHYHPHGWSPDGRDLIAVLNSYSPTNWDILRIPLEGERTPHAIMRTPLVEGIGGAALSPDGRWLAYTSNATGSLEVWVRPYAGGGAPVRISVDGGSDPVWARNGRELFYLQGDRMMAAAVDAGATFDFKAPVMLFRSPYGHNPVVPVAYDVAPDGRFLMIKQTNGQPETSPITVVLNWTAGGPR